MIFMMRKGCCCSPLLVSSVSTATWCYLFVVWCWLRHERRRNRDAEKTNIPHRARGWVKLKPELLTYIATQHEHGRMGMNPCAERG